MHETNGLTNGLTVLLNSVGFDFALCRHSNFDKNFDPCFQLSCVYFWIYCWRYLHKTVTLFSIRKESKGILFYYSLLFPT